jgi:hypothetical protein
LARPNSVWRKAAGRITQDVSPPEPSDAMRTKQAAPPALNAVSHISAVNNSQLVSQTFSRDDQRMTLSGVVAFGEAEARETVNPRFGQIVKVSSSKAAATRKVAASSTPSS